MSKPSWFDMMDMADRWFETKPSKASKHKVKLSLSGYLFHGKLIKRKPHSDAKGDYIVIDKRLIENPNAFKDRIAIIVAADRNTIIISSVSASKAFFGGLGRHTTSVDFEGENILVKMPEALKDFYMWSNSVVRVAGATDYAMATFETIIPVGDAPK